MTGLGEGILRGERRALAKGLTLVESNAPEAADLLRRLRHRTGKGRVVGITGAPGAGKSTLIDRLARIFAQRGHRVGVLAVDPTSPFSGGALLGDRVRMDAADPRVFIRSLATRGHAGGVSRTLGASIGLMEAFGMDRILVETVGAGQSEVAIMAHADLTAVVLVPGLGDDIQAHKAGILEIGDLFVVNKADRPGADLVVRELAQMLSLGERGEGRDRPPILQTVADRGEGVDALVEALEARLSSLDTGAVLRRRRREAERQLVEALSDRMVAALRRRTEPDGRWEGTVRAIMDRSMDPEGGAQALLEGLPIFEGGKQA